MLWEFKTPMTEGFYRPFLVKGDDKIEQLTVGELHYMKRAIYCSFAITVNVAFWFVALWLLLRVTLALLRPLSWVMGTLAGLLARVAGSTVSPGARGSLAVAAAGSGRPMAPSR